MLQEEKSPIPPPADVEQLSEEVPDMLGAGAGEATEEVTDNYDN